MLKILIFHWITMNSQSFHLKSTSKLFQLTKNFLIVYCEHLGHSVFHFYIKSNINISSLKQFYYFFSLRMFKIGRVYIPIFHCAICLQLLLFYFSEAVSMNTFLNNAINIFCCKYIFAHFYT